MRRIGLRSCELVQMGVCWCSRIPFSGWLKRETERKADHCEGSAALRHVPDHSGADKAAKGRQARLTAAT